jgi:hypothetical protein
MRVNQLFVILPFAAVMLLGASCVQQPAGNPKSLNQPVVNAENKNVNQPAVNAPAEEGVSAQADAEWLTYTDPKGRFAFEHPVNIEVRTDEHAVTFDLLPKTKEKSAMADMSIEVQVTSVKFTVWEGKDVKYFKGVVDSFRFPGHEAGSDWKTYNDPNGKYFFQHPAGVKAEASKDGGTVEMRNAVDLAQEVPDMVIKISDTSVEFSTWEKAEVEYFRGLVSSFKFR